VEVFTIANDVRGRLGYTIEADAGLTVDPAEGTLARRQPDEITVTVGADVGEEFSGDVTITAGEEVAVVTVTTCPDFFTMSLGSAEDLLAEVGDKTFLFAPNGETYTATQGDADLASTTGAVDADLGVPVALPAPVALFGTEYDQITVLEDGAVELSNAKTLADHFASPAVSGLRTDLDATATGASVTLLEAADGVVVTYTDIPETGVTDTNTFQIVLYNDGNIELSYEDVTAVSAVIGLSGGGGEVPDCFVESDFSNYAETTAAAKAAL
jgi:hypothetical protein